MKGLRLLAQSDRHCKYGFQTRNQGLTYILSAIVVNIKIKPGAELVAQSGRQVAHRSNLFGTY